MLRNGTRPALAVAHTITLVDGVDDGFESRGRVAIISQAVAHLYTVLLILSSAVAARLVGMIARRL